MSEVKLEFEDPSNQFTYVGNAKRAMEAYNDASARTEELEHLVDQRTELIQRISFAEGAGALLKNSVGKFDLDAMLAATSEELPVLLAKKLVSDNVINAIKSARSDRGVPTQIGGYPYFTQVHVIGKEVLYRRFAHPSPFMPPRDHFISEAVPGDVLRGRAVLADSSPRYGGRLILKNRFGALDITGLVDSNAQPQVQVALEVPKKLK